MTDLEIMQRAKMYLDRLAQGIDPISGREMPEDTILNQARLARCFSYVSGILQQVIDNGGTVGPLQRNDFTWTPEMLSRLTGKDREYAELLCPMEKWKRDQLAQELTAWRTLLADALLARGGMRASSPLAAKIAEKRQGGDLLSAVDVLQKAIDYTQGNVSPAAVCGWLFFALRK